MFYLQPLGASDYLELSQAFHTVIIRDVPQLDFRLKSQTRRFITLIDTLYDNKVSLHMFYLLFIFNNLNHYKCLCLNKKKFCQVRVVISAAVPHTELFIPQGDSEYTDEKRMLMDDLKISHGSVSYETKVVVFIN